MSFRERRAAERTWGAYRDALLSIPRLKHVHSRGVRDLSNEGAGPRLNGLPLLPVISISRSTAFIPRSLVG